MFWEGAQGSNDRVPGALSLFSSAPYLPLRANSFGMKPQDGPLAGQSVPHTHVHIMPRHPGDFKPLDAIYSALDGVNFQEDYARRKTRDDRLQARAGVDAEEDRAARSGEEMREEAERLSLLFPEDVRGTFD